VSVGRPPKPSAILRLEGSPKAAARERAEPKVPLGDPEPPDWLSDEARGFWESTLAMLRDVPGLMSRVDGIALASFAQALADYTHAKAKVAAEGITVEGSLGSKVLNPSVRAMELAWARVQKGVSQFGLSPSDRGKVIVGNGKGKASDGKGYFAAG
jgi:P27 family predicted phage terminase small subunit